MALDDMGADGLCGSRWLQMAGVLMTSCLQMATLGMGVDGFRGCRWLQMTWAQMVTDGMGADGFRGYRWLQMAGSQMTFMVADGCRWQGRR